MYIMNRNTSPISPINKEIYQKASQITQPNQYPESELARFKDLYAELTGLDPAQLELANGSDEWIQKLMIVYGCRGVLAVHPDFFMYQDYANQIGVDITFVDSDEDYNFNLNDILAEIDRVKPSLFIFSNPNNPTGYQFSEDFIQALADKMEEVGGKLAIDEAYIEFGNPNYKRPSGDHIIIIRTMSKIYGMAGLRIGIMSARGQTFEELTKINHPYPVNNISLNLANEFLADKAHLVSFVDYQLLSRDRLVEAFKSVKEIVKAKDTSTNFIFTYGKEALSLGEYLLEAGFQPRFYQPQERVGDVVRYSILEIEAYPKLEKAINEWRKTNDY